MTPGEILTVLNHSFETEKARKKAETINAASIAYYSAAFSRCKTFPSTICEAFPALFGRTEDGQISVENIEESERGMDRFFRAYGQKAVN